MITTRTQSRQRRLAILFVILAGSMLSYAATAEAKSEYEIINTGIKGGGCWVDDKHFVVETRVQRPGSQDSDLEGLYVLDPSQPTTLQPLSLSPLETAVQKRVWSVSCQDGQVVFLASGIKEESSRLYRLKIGGEPELIVDMRLPRVSLKGEYVLGNNRRARTTHGPFPGTFDPNADCQVSYSSPAFKVLCSDWWFVQQWPLEKLIVSAYQWRDTIGVLGEDGKRKEIPNPEKPRLDRQGKPKRYELFLRDLSGKVLWDLRDDPNYWVIPIEGIATSFDERYLYIVCGKRGQKFDDAPYVCRYPLDGLPHQWEEVVSLPADQIQRGGSVRHISVSRGGDIVFFIAGGMHPNNGIWLLQASTKHLIQVTTPDKYVYDEAPRISPNGNHITFMRKGILMLARKKGERP
jgi:hypothetical protein